MTTDETIMKDIVVKDDDFVNNKPAMEAMAADTSYQSKVLGGQNPLSMYCASVEKLDLSCRSSFFAVKARRDAWSGWRIRFRKVNTGKGYHWAFAG